MNYIILYGAIQAFFMTLLIINKKKKSAADYVLGLWLLFIGFHVLSFFVYKNQIHAEIKHLLDINLAFPLLNGPFLYTYVNRLVKKERKFKWTSLLHFLPFVLVSFFLTHNVVFGIKGDSLRYYSSIVFLRNTSFLFQFFNLLILLSMPLYMVLCLILLRKYHHLIRNNLSSIQHITLKWLTYLVVGFGMVWSSVFILHIVINIRELSPEFINQIVFSSYTVFVFAMGYFGFRQSFVFSDIPTPIIATQPESYGLVAEDSIERQKYKQSGLKADQAKKLHARLLEHMESEKPFEDNNLTLVKLSEQLEVSPYYLSQVLNEEQKQNFYDFINYYRVEEFIKRVSDPKNKNFTLLAIAYDCGFNSKASFNRIVKNATGKVPSEFRG